MKFTSTTAKTALGAAGIAAVSLFAAGTASAAPTIVEGLGTPETLVSGPLSTDYTVSNLQPATVTIPGYTPKGKLWQADVQIRSNSGVVTPVVSDFNARAEGQNYRVISTKATPEGVSPAPLTQGNTASGKIYFDVTGASPTKVAYNDGTQDVLVWTNNGIGTPVPGEAQSPAPNGMTRPGQVQSPAPDQVPTGTGRASAAN